MDKLQQKSGIFTVNNLLKHNESIISRVPKYDSAAALKAISDNFYNTSSASLKEIIQSMVNIKMDQDPLADPERVADQIHQLKRQFMAGLPPNPTAEMVVDILATSSFTHALNDKYEIVKLSLHNSNKNDLVDAINAAKMHYRQLKYNAAQHNSASSSSTSMEAELSQDTAYALKARTQDSRYCNHCKRYRHTDADCWILHPHLKPTYVLTREQEQAARNKLVDKPSISTRETRSSSCKSKYSVNLYPNTKNSNTAYTLKGKRTEMTNEEVRFKFIDAIDAQIDSGASDHFSNSKRGFLKFDSNETIEVQLANNESCRTEGVGYISEILDRVHLISDLSSEMLISTVRLMEKGVKTVISNKGSQLITEKDNKIIGPLHIRDGGIFIELKIKLNGNLGNTKTKYN